jgi:glutathione S-transferase
MFRTAKLRKASNIPYPNAYATHEQAEKDVNAYRFNCGKSSFGLNLNPNLNL